MLPRRRFIGGLGVMAFTGCSEVAASEQFQEFESDINSTDIDVRAIAEEERRWVMEYYPVTSSREELFGEIGTIARVYSETVPTASEDESHRQLDSILFRVDDTRVGSFSINATTAREFRSGDLSSDDYLRQILASTRVGSR